MGNQIQRAAKAYLNVLPDALAGGAGAPTFSQGISGAFQGIEEQKRYRQQQADATQQRSLQMQQYQRQSQMDDLQAANLRSLIADRMKPTPIPEVNDQLMTDPSSGKVFGVNPRTLVSRPVIAGEWSADAALPISPQDYTQPGPQLTLTQKPVAPPNVDHNTITTDRGIFQYNEATNRYDIPAGQAPARTDKTPGQDAFERTLGQNAAKDIETARSADFRYRSMQGSYDKATKGDQQAALNLLANHIGMTLGLQRGARITQTILDEAIKSAPWLQRIGARFDGSGYLSGVTLTPGQMRQMMDLASEQRGNAWQQAQESSKQAGVADRVQLPGDLNAPRSPSTAVPTYDQNGNRVQ